MSTAALTTSPPVSHETAASAAAAQAKALVESRYTVAIARPRDMDAVRTNLLKECQRPTFADSARYSRKQGKKFNDATGKWEDNYIEGPSIRFAEAAMRCMGNLNTSETTTYDDEDKRVLEITVTDLESNVTQGTSVTIAKVIERKKPREGDTVLGKRKNSSGDDVHLVRATEDEMLNRKNALASKALRGLLLRCLPGDVIDEAMEIVIKVQQDRDAKDPDAAKRKVLDAFMSINVPVSELKKYTGHDLSTVSPKELVDLRALHAAIKEGETTWRAAMEERFPSESLAERMKGDLGGGAAQPSAPPPAKAPPKTPAAKVPSAADVVAAFKRAADSTDVHQANAVLDRHCEQATTADKVPAELRAVVIQGLNDLAGV
jgi:hypothetical protein